MSVRAKFRVGSVSRNEDGSGTVSLSVVTSGSPENESFFRATPGGSISLSTINAEALEQFEEGKEVYVDFSAAEEAGE